MTNSTVNHIISALPVTDTSNLSSPPLNDGNQTVDPKIWKAASDFEAMTIDQLLEPMFSTIDTSKDLFSGGAGEESFKPMLIDEMAKNMEKAGGIGLTGAIYKQMLAIQEKKK